MTCDFRQCGILTSVELRNRLNNIWSVLVKQEAAQARLSLHLSKCHIVGNDMT